MCPTGAGVHRRNQHKTVGVGEGHHGSGIPVDVLTPAGVQGIRNSCIARDIQEAIIDG